MSRGAPRVGITMLSIATTSTPRNRRRSVERQALGRVHIDEREDAHLAAVRDDVLHEVHRPALIRGGRNTPFRSRHRTPQAFGFAPVQSEFLLATEPIHALLIYPPPFKLEQFMQSEIAIAEPRSGQLSQSRA